MCSRDSCICSQRNVGITLKSVISRTITLKLSRWFGMWAGLCLILKCVSGSGADCFDSGEFLSRSCSSVRDQMLLHEGGGGADPRGRHRDRYLTHIHSLQPTLTHFNSLHHYLTLDPPLRLLQVFKLIKSQWRRRSSLWTCFIRRDEVLSPLFFFSASNCAD